MRLLDEKDVVRLLRSEIERAGSQRAFARKTGVDRSTLNRALHGKRSPLTKKIIKALKLRMVFVPEGAGGERLGR
jgi:DNA-binding phage protein